jgi:hypothetical protein
MELLSALRLQVFIRGQLHLRFWCAVWMCISLSNAFLMSFSVLKTNKSASKTHLTVKRTSKLHIQNGRIKWTPRQIYNNSLKPKKCVGFSPSVKLENKMYQIWGKRGSLLSSIGEYRIFGLGAPPLEVIERIEPHCLCKKWFKTLYIVAKIRFFKLVELVD